MTKVTLVEDNHLVQAPRKRTPLDILTLAFEQQVWIKTTGLREKARDSLEDSDERLGAALWIGHILRRLQLTDNTRRTTYSGGQLCLMDWEKVLDMMALRDRPYFKSYGRSKFYS